METSRTFTSNEKLSLGLFIVFFPVNLGAAVSLYPGDVVTGQELATGFLLGLAWFLIGFVALCVSAATVFLAPDDHPSRLRKNLGRLLPLTALLIASSLSSIGWNKFLNDEMRQFAQLHSKDLAGPTPRAVVYREGIPDGGLAIVRSPGSNPESFSQQVMVDLTGERIKSCRPLDASDWSCHFD